MGSSKKMCRQESSVKKCLKLPILILIRAKDLYVDRMIGGASHMTYGNAMGCPTPIIPTLLRRSCTKSGKEVFTNDETISRHGRIDTELRLKSKGVGKLVSPAKIVSIGRIDEDKEYEYGAYNVGLLSVKFE